jgi:peptide/nickel transport system substrate-binding protein
VLRILFDSAGTIPAPSGYFANHSQVKDDALDALLQSAGATSDEAERADDYAAAQQIVLEGYYILPLYDQQNHFLLRADVEGLRAMPTVSTPTLYDTWLDR